MRLVIPIKSSQAKIGGGGVEKSWKVISIVESMKLLGVIVSSDMKWHLNTEYITKRGYSRIWILRRLKKYGVPTSELIDAYIQKVRSLLEMAVPVWNPALTRGEATLIERVQKSALRVILGDQYLSYNQAMMTLGLDNLESRREKLCVSFASKAANHEKYSEWFWTPDRRPDTRYQAKYTPVWTRTTRYKKSPLPYLTDLLNNHLK